MKKLILVILICTLSPLSFAENLLVKGLSLYNDGEVEKAAQTFEQYHKLALSTKDDDAIWDAYSALAWFYHEISDNKKSIGYSLSALQVANRIKDPFQIGRSLSFLGWSYAQLGSYKLAVEFFNKAIKISSDEKTIKLPMVWGLASQELGRLYMRTGKTDKAEELLHATYMYAVKNKVLVGISESGAHLARLELQKGNIGTAEKYALKSVKASKDCNCSANNMARSLIVYARALFEKDLKLPEGESGDDSAENAIQDAIDAAVKTKNRKFIAEGKILLSKTMTDGNPEARLELIDEALDLMKDIGSVDTGSALLEKSIIHLENEDVEMAEALLKEGIKDSAKKFQYVTKAYMTSQAAAISEFKEEPKKQIEILIKLSEKNSEKKLYPLIYENNKKLMNIFIEGGYLKLALASGLHALKAHKVIRKEEKNKAIKEKLIEEEIELKQFLAEVKLELQAENNFEPGR